MSAIADEYEPLEVIGKGSFGTVRKVRHRASGSILVRKEIEYTAMSTQEKNHIISELRILRELDHPHIVKYLRHDHIPEKKCIHIYQEFCDGGDLGKVISTYKRNKEHVPEDFIWGVLVQTLLALHRCHYGMDLKRVDLFGPLEATSEPAIDSETVVIHRDIKPENIFLHESRKTVKLGDFGLAKMLTSQNDFAKTYVGTPYYMSPEVLMDNPYSPVCDIWSLGCVLFELCNLHPPFQAKTHLLLQAKIRNGAIPEISPTYSAHLRNIIRESITVDPESRPTCYELLNTVTVQMFRKEMELKNYNDTLNDFLCQLKLKNEELKKREAAFLTLERREQALVNLEKREQAVHKLELKYQALQSMEAHIQAQRRELERHVALKKKELDEDYSMLQAKCAQHKDRLEKELMEDFDLRKRAMEQEGKEMRLHYQREFRHVVEQEVQARLSLMQRKNMESDMELRRKKSDSSASSMERVYRPQLPTKPRGPKEYVEDAQESWQHQQAYQYSPQRRTPLKTRNSELELEPPKAVPVRGANVNYKKRITDEFERLNLQKRNIPEFEEQYMRNRIA